MGIDGAEIKRRREVVEKKPQLPPKVTPNTKPPRTILYSIGFVLIGIVLFICSGPILTLKNIGQAAYESDTARLEENIDFYTLQKNVKKQLKDQINATMDKDLQGNPFASFAKGMIGSFTDTTVDKLLNPEGISRMVNSSKKENGPPGLLNFIKNIRYSVKSTDTVVATIGKEDDTDNIKLVLKRSGISWKLENMLLVNGGMVGDIKNETNSKPTVATEKVREPDPLYLPNESPEEIKRHCLNRWTSNKVKAKECMTRNLALNAAMLKDEILRREQELSNELHTMLNDGERNCRVDHTFGSYEYKECMEWIKEQRLEVEQKYN